MFAQRRAIAAKWLPEVETLLSGLSKLLSGTCALVLCTAAVPQAETLTTTSFNMYGLPSGLIDMPTAEMAPDAQFTSTISHFADSTRVTLSFQIAPRLTGSFRYSAVEGLQIPGYTLSSYYDRSFDLRYQFLDEGTYRPAMAVGLRDFIGTGLYGSEYLVATKSLGDKWRVTGGVGWGRLGSANSFASSGTRPTGYLGTGGLPSLDKFFRGDMAAFGGVSYQHSDKLRLKMEYSSDAYTQEVGDGLFTRDGALNFGAEYQFAQGAQLGLYAMHGGNLAAMVSFSTNPKTAPVPGSADVAPLAVLPRGKSARDLGWSTQPQAVGQTVANLKTLVEFEGLTLESYKLTGTSVRLVVRNPRFEAGAQLLGRVARGATRALPASVETITVVQTSHGVPLSSASFKRSDLERYEYAPAEVMYDRMVLTDGADALEGTVAMTDAYPRFEWALTPYVSMSMFDPQSPVRADGGLKLSGDWHIAPGWVASGDITAKLAGNRDELRPATSTGLPLVRSDFAEYSRGQDVAMPNLSLAYYGRLGEDLYSRVTTGYLERGFAGVSGEVLWKPVGSRLALGGEVNYVAKRAYDDAFGLQDYEVATGHGSVYYDMGKGYHVQVDAGRYLAGDWGATVAIDREFANGWSIGAYATKTNISAAQFGEGSFDKGIRFTMPLAWALGTSTRAKTSASVASLTRDGGARLRVQGRLYEQVRDAHEPELAKSWGKFWR